MFGRDKDKKNDKEIAEIKMGRLNTFYIDRISQKRKETNKRSREDVIITILTDASETDFKRILDEYISEKGYFDGDKFQFYIVSKGYYCVDLRRSPMFPGEW